jgi:hypothetical protein
VKLEIPHPDRGFKTITKDGLTLIVPRNDKFDWTPEDRPYRSVVIDENNEVVSSSFPKFGNLGESGYEDHKALIESGSDVIYTEKIDGCLHYETKLNLWGGGSLSIGQIVNQRLTPTLIGYDHQLGKIVPCQIKDWHDNGSKSNWLCIEIDCDPFEKQSNCHPNILRVTTNHEIIVNNEWKTAGDIQTGDTLIHNELYLDDRALHVIRSGLLGDGSLAPHGKKGAKYSEPHSPKQHDYTDYLRKWIGHPNGNRSNTTSGYGSDMKWAETQSLQSLRTIREEWYPAGKKIIPDDVSWIDDFAVAKWYMDNGSLVHSEFQEDRAIFSTHSFTKEDVDRLGRVLHHRYGVDARTAYSKGWYLRINAGKNGEIDQLWLGIAPHIIPSLKYKLPERYRPIAYQEREAGAVIYKPISVKVLNVTATKKYRSPTGYDITTSTNNYFAKGVLVHNSTALRSVINGQVVWRTRGTLDGGLHREQIEKAAGRHPDLADPHFCPFGTFIFEFVSPDFRIILPYKEDKLIFLGYITHSDLSLLDWNRTKAMATLYDFELVPTHDLPSDLDELIAIVSKWGGQEGIVARTKDGKALVKAKSASYLALHRLKFQLSTNALRDLCDEKDITSLDDFKAYILTQGADWELLQDCEPIVQVYCNTRAQIDACFFALQMVHEQKVKEFPTRKDFAVEYANKAPVVERPSIYLLLDGQPEEAKRKLHKNMMDAAFEQFKDLDPEWILDYD